MKYHFYTDGKKKVICTTTFAKKMVKGVAVCSDEDTFDLETGKKLAQARADVAYAKKRFDYAKDEFEAAVVLKDYADSWARSRSDYYNDCHKDLEAYQEAQYKLEEELGL